MEPHTALSMLRTATAVAEAVADVTRRTVSQASQSFAEIFAESPAPPSESEGGDQIQLGRIEEAVNGAATNPRPRLIEAVKQLLNRIGITHDAPIRIDFQPDGRPQVSGEHPRSSEIETAIRDDPNVQSWARRLTGEHPHARSIVIPGPVP